MDLSELLNIPPSGLSLGGELGIAFGARGSGGKNSANAHYESSNVVINLTKEKGAGSLAHEWFHAVDNYFERKRGRNSNFITDSPLQRIKNDGTFDDSIRKEVLDAFKGVRDVINKSQLYERSSKLDVRRSKDYWNTGVEMAARSFETYVKMKLENKGIKNDHLVSLKDIVEYIIQSGASEDSYPYPTQEESVKINEAFDNLFNVIKTEEREDGNVVMFRANNPTFYANSEKALESLSDNNRTPEQWKTELLKNGAKESELNYMGWNQFVEGKRTLTKNDLTEFVNSNKVQVEEVVKETIETILTNPDFDTQALFGGQNGTTRYSSYTTRGGKNYREVLLTLPDNTKYKLSDKEVEQKAIEEGFRFDVFPNKVLIFKDGDVWDEQKDMATVISVMRNRYKDGTIVHTNTFTSPHFNEPNIATHVRLSEFTDKQGRRVLLVEEVLS